MGDMEVLTHRDARQVAGELIQARDACRALEVLELDLVAELVDLYDTVPDALVEGAERLVPSGHDGTPAYAEFLVLELAAMLATSVESARSLICDVMDLRERMPRTWEAAHRGLLPAWQARRLAQRTSLLDLDACRSVDTALFPALGRLPWPRVLRKLGGLIVAADPAGARERAEAKRAGLFVRVTHEGEGISSVFARLRTEDALVLANAVETLAQQQVTDGATAPIDQLRAEALTSLARPSDGPTGLPRPVATLVVHVAPGSAVARPELVGPGAGRGEGELGALLVEQVRDLLQHHRVRVLPVIDLNEDPAVDAYEVPTGIRRHVVCRDGFEVFPFSAKGAVTCEADHTVPWLPHRGRGQTRPGNLGSLSKFAHRAKTHTAWRYDQAGPGRFAITSPLGFVYEVDRQGTHRRLLTRHIPPRPVRVGFDVERRPDLPRLAG